MEQSQSFQRAELGPFLQALIQRPALCQSVELDIRATQRAVMSRHCQDVLAGRDAAARLRDCADSLGFPDVAQVFYTSYEYFCLRLLSLLSL